MLFAVLTILAAVMMLIGSFVRFALEMLRVISGDTSPETGFVILIAGIVMFTVWTAAASRALGRTGFHKKLGKIIGGAKRFRIPALCFALGKDLEWVSTQLNQLISRGYLKGAQISLDDKELILDGGSEPLPVPLDEPDTVYKQHRRLPVMAFLMAASVFGMILALGGITWLLTGAIAGAIVFVWGIFAHPMPVFYTEAPRPVPRSVKPKAPAKTGNPELDEMLRDIARHQAELVRIGFVLEKAPIHKALAEITRLLEEITRYVTEHPEKVKQLRQFNNYYLPTTVKLLQNYEELYGRRDKGENIVTTMKKIEGMTGKIIEVFKREYDELFTDRAMDISAEIAVMKQMISE